MITIVYFLFLRMQQAIFKLQIKILMFEYFVVTLIQKIITPLKKQKNLACHYIVTVWDRTEVKGRHYIVTSIGV